MILFYIFNWESIEYSKNSIVSRLLLIKIIKIALYLSINDFENFILLLLKS